MPLKNLYINKRILSLPVYSLIIFEFAIIYLDMNINLDYFWKFIREWTVGRLIVLLALLYILFTRIIVNELMVMKLILTGVFLEIFELSLNKINKSRNCFICFVFFLTMIFPIIGIGIIFFKTIL